MLEVGDVIVSPRGTRVEVIENSPERIAVKREMPPLTGGKQGKPHRHVGSVETFELLEGEATGWFDGRARALAPGDVVEVPPDAPHVNPYTEAGKTATLVHAFSPRSADVEGYFTSWLGWLGQGTVDEREEPTFWQLAAIVRAGRGGSWAVGPPVIVQRMVLPVLGLIADRRGVRAQRIVRPDPHAAGA